MRIPVVDVRGQYNHLIARALIDVDLETRLIPISITKEKLDQMNAKGLVMGGGPQRIGSEVTKFDKLSDVIREIEIPILGICVTHQLIAFVFGGKAGPAKSPEYGPVRVYVDEKDGIFKNFEDSFTAWETHNDEVLELPKDFKILAHSDKCKVQAMKHINRPIFGVQFHPEVVHTERGHLIFKNFVEICKE